MSVQTQTIWQIPMSTEIKDQIEIKAQELTAQGKEIGNAVITTENNLATVVRTWIDNETADEWVTYVLTYNPVSSVVIG
jgi:hypothetical protein